LTVGRQTTDSRLTGAVPHNYPIVNHFWYCCQVADGSVEELKVHVIVNTFLCTSNCLIVLCFIGYDAICGTVS